MPIIYYDGIGAKKSGKHTVSEFLNIMKKPENNESCSRWLIGIGYKPCIQEKKMFTRKNFKGLTEKQKKVFSKCLLKKFHTKTLKSRKYKCDLEKYITYSGAVRK